MKNWKFFKLLVVAVILLKNVNCKPIEEDDESSEIIEAKSEHEVKSDYEMPVTGKKSDIEPTEGAVKYNGAQLWRIPYTNQTYKNAVIELQKNFQISMWNLQKGHVDVFVKQPVVKSAKQLLKNSNVPFEVVIDDLQKAIDEENPPKEQIVEWQVRNGKMLLISLYENN